MNRKESEKLSEYYKAVAKEEKCFFLDAAEYVNTSEIDGLHLPLTEHTKLGEAIYKEVLCIFPEE